MCRTSTWGEPNSPNVLFVENKALGNFLESLRAQGVLGWRGCRDSAVPGAVGSAAGLVLGCGAGGVWGGWSVPAVEFLNRTAAGNSCLYLHDSV